VYFLNIKRQKKIAYFFSGLCYNGKNRAEVFKKGGMLFYTEGSYPFRWQNCMNRWGAAKLKEKEKPAEE
jgi:hypothetical protein